MILEYADISALRKINGHNLKQMLVDSIPVHIHQSSSYSKGQLMQSTKGFDINVKNHQCGALNIKNSVLTE